MTLKVFETIKRGLSLEHEDLESFIKCQWQRKNKPNVLYLTFRSLIALYWLVTLLYALINPNQPALSISHNFKCFLYLTYWTYIICTLQAVLSVAMLLSNMFTKKLVNQIYKFYWVLHTIALDFSFVVTVYYWALVYDPKVMKGNNEITTLFVHTLNCSIMFLDFCFIAHPIKPLHCVYSITYGVFYWGFTGIYYSAGGISREGTHYMYKVMDWELPWRCVIVLVATSAFLAVIHFAYWGLHKFKNFLKAMAFKVEGKYDFKSVMV